MSLGLKAHLKPLRGLDFELTSYLRDGIFCGLTQIKSLQTLAENEKFQSKIRAYQ